MIFENRYTFDNCVSYEGQFDLLDNSNNLATTLMASMLIIVSHTTFAKDQFEKEVIESNSSTLDELTGVIIDRTVTFMGHDFYRDFSDYWSLNNTASKATLTIKERPSARWGSLIWIEYRSENIAKFFVSPGKKNTPQAIEQVAMQVQQTLLKKKISEQFQDKFDLDTNEL